MNQGLNISERLKAASALPDGARFYRCALQVNPFGYLGRHNKQTIFQDEASYNAAIVATCRVDRPEAITMVSAMLLLPCNGIVTRSCAWSSSSDCRITSSRLVRWVRGAGLASARMG